MDELFPALYAFIFGAIAALAIWSVDQKKLSKWTAWVAVVASGMFFRIAGQV